MNKTSITLLAILTICSIGLTTNSVFAATDLPPLVLKSPESSIKTVEGKYYVYDIRPSSFLITDDSGETSSIICSIGTNAKQVTNSNNDMSYKSDIQSKQNEISNYNRYTNVYNAYWILPAGEHTVLCEIEDNNNNISETEHIVTIISDTLAPRWVKTVAGFYTSNLIDQPTYLKVIKYFNLAEVMVFDIENDDSTADSDRIPSSFKTNTKKWVDNTWTNTQYKNTLESMADKGIFDNVNLGF